MSQNITKLKVKWPKAIELILQGKKDSEVAAALGITRETVNRWKNQDDDFIVALNVTRLKIWEKFYDRLRSLVTPAIDVLEKDIQESCSVRTSLEILKIVGLYGTIPHPDGPYTQEELERDKKMSERFSSLKF